MMCLSLMTLMIIFSTDKNKKKQSLLIFVRTQAQPRSRACATPHIATRVVADRTRYVSSAGFLVSKEAAGMTKAKAGQGHGDFRSMIFWTKQQAEIILTEPLLKKPNCFVVVDLFLFLA